LNCRVALASSGQMLDGTSRLHRRIKWLSGMATFSLSLLFCGKAPRQFFLSCMRAIESSVSSGLTEVYMHDHPSYIILSRLPLVSQKAGCKKQVPPCLFLAPFSFFLYVIEIGPLPNVGRKVQKGLRIPPPPPVRGFGHPRILISSKTFCCMRTPFPPRQSPRSTRPKRVLTPGTQSTERLTPPLVHPSIFGKAVNSRHTTVPLFSPCPESQSDVAVIRLIKDIPPTIPSYYSSRDGLVARWAYLLR